MEAAVLAQGERRITFRQAIQEALAEEMRRDERVFVMGEDVAGGRLRAHLEEAEAWGGVMAVTKGLVGEFGRRRVIDTPISEMAFMGAAAGAAAVGLRPVVELMFVDFHGVCWDQIFNQAAKMRYMLGGQVRMPLVIRTTIGAGIGEAGQHSGCHYSVFTHMPGIKCVVPSTPGDAKGLLISAIRDDDLVVVFEHKLLYSSKGLVESNPIPIPLGTARVTREGKDVAVIAIGLMVARAEAAADRLDNEGISCHVVDLRSTSPIDEETVVQAALQTGRVVVVDEDNPLCSVASELSALIGEKVFGRLQAPVRRVCAPHAPVPFSPRLETAYMPSVDAICEAVKQTFDPARHA
jgi:pyruvate/2-oxoglutarate/acetoin dehydrogenase E1 component